jgi:muconate cycloisomerase
MARIAGIELYELDLPFRHPFRHAAAERLHSESLFLRCITDGGQVGYGETLPRPYVTGEDRRSTFDLLAARILPRVLEQSFASFEEVHAFLARCDGKAPADWVPLETAQSAAWCAVDLALLDTFGRAFGTALAAGLPDGTSPPRGGVWPEGLRYSLVLSGDGGARAVETLIKARLYGIRDAKVKVGGPPASDSSAGVRLARRILGRGARIRVDCNMAWTLDAAPAAMLRLAHEGVDSFEQPLAASDVDGLARLGAETGLAIMADESFHDAASLERLIAARACASFNVRIAKCGGVVASLARCRRILDAGLKLQVGCQVGETSQLSAAQMTLVRTLGGGIDHLEGCYGQRLLRVDPVMPLLQFRRGGTPPPAPRGAGFGTNVDLAIIQQHAGRRVALGAGLPARTKEPS